MYGSDCHNDGASRGASVSRWRADDVAGGVPLRELLIEAGHPPYNPPATGINCRGIGTCGTCAVEVSVP